VLQAEAWRAGEGAGPSAFIYGPGKKVITYELVRIRLFLGTLYLWFIYGRCNPLTLLCVEEVDING